MRDASVELATLAEDRAADRVAPFVVGITGAVASGKSTLAEAVAGAVRARGGTSDVVTTDGFLLPNRVLHERGLAMRKGFPESYDVDALTAFVDAVHGGATDLTVPVYSHVTYDVVPGRGRPLAPASVVVVEGVNTLGALAGRLDLAVYLDASEADLEQWFLTRFHALCHEARSDPASFYRPFASMRADEVDAIACGTWTGINLVNLREHILPTRALADVVVSKGPDHRVLSIEVREHADPEDERS